MTVTIRLPEALRSLADGAAAVEVRASTVGEALRQLADRYPPAGPHIFDEHGEPRGFVNTFINDTEARTLGGVDAPVRSGDTITIVPSIAGGTTCQNYWRKT